MMLSFSRTPDAAHGRVFPTKDHLREDGRKSTRAQDKTHSLDRLSVPEATLWQR